LISAVGYELLINVDQYGKHSDGRCKQERGDEPLIVVNKKKSNTATWTIVQQGISLGECNAIVDRFTFFQNNGTGYIYKSPQFPDYIMRRYHYFIMRCVYLTLSQTIEFEYLVEYTMYTKQGTAILLPLLPLSLLN
jgi:hypothetical protein